MTVAAMALLLTPGMAHAKDPEPAVKIALGPLGYPRRPPNRMLSGNAMFTLNYVDPTHLLFTFTEHGLLRRIPHDPPDDEDRDVAALVLELPSGRVVARTEWRLHDYGQYLWNLGGGRFLLRRRNELTTFAPMANAAEPFAEQEMLKLGGELTFLDIGLSSDHGVLVLEVIPEKPPPGSAQRAFGAEPRPPVAVQFIRLLPTEKLSDPVRFRVDTALERPGPTEFSLTSNGFMEVKREAQYRWGFDYREYTGQVKPLAGLESSCPPFPVFVSGSEFVTFGCRGSEYKSSLTGFSLSGDISWEMTFGEPQGYSSLSSAPEAGRFAISRSIGSGFDPPRTPSQISSQEVRVIQSYDGKQLLRVVCSPVQASGQNFAISPDGLSVAVMQDGISIYSLPALNEGDKKAIATAQALVPRVPLEAKVNLLGGPPELPRQPASAEPAQPGGMPSLSGGPPSQGGGDTEPDPSRVLIQGDEKEHSPLEQRKPTIFLPQ